MFNSPLVADRVQTVRASLGRLRGLAAADRGAFRGSPDDYAIAEHHLRRALQALLDIGRHIVVRCGWGNPAHYRDILQSRLDDIADFLKALALYVGSEAALPED